MDCTPPPTPHSWLLYQISFDLILNILTDICSKPQVQQNFYNLIVVVMSWADQKNKTETNEHSYVPE